MWKLLSFGFCLSLLLRWRRSLGLFGIQGSRRIPLATKAVPGIMDPDLPSARDLNDVPSTAHDGELRLISV